MQRMLTLVALLLALGMAASLAVADMDGSRVPPKGTEGPDISVTVEPKGVEGPDVRHAPSPVLPNVEGVVTR
jgi:hypothetical protein